MSRLLFFVYSEDEEARSKISRKLAATGRVELIASIPSSPEVLAEVLTTSQLDGLYVDLGNRPEQVLEILENAPQPRPSLILGGSDTETPILLRAMRLQPLDFLVGHEVENLAPILDRITADTKPRRRRRDRNGTLAVAGAKGGVGTTFVACELASALQQLGDRVVVVDLNLYIGDAAMYFDLRPPYTIADVAKKGEGLDRTFLSSTLATHLSGVRVLGSPAEVEDIGMISARQIEQTLGMLREEFEWVVVDLPHAWDDVSLQALNLADQILLVTNLDVPSLSHTRRQLELLSRFGAPDESIRVIVNRYTQTETFGEKELREFMGRAPDLCLPADGVAPLRCMNEGKLMREIARGCKLERALVQLGDAACEWTTGEAAPPRDRPALLQRVRGFVLGS